MKPVTKEDKGKGHGQCMTGREFTVLTINILDVRTRSLSERDECVPEYLSK